MGNDVYLGLSVLKEGAMAGGYMAFLILAASEDEASHTADLFVGYVETLGDDDRTPEQVRSCQRGLVTLRPRVVLVQHDDEIRALSTTLAANFPGIAAHLLNEAGTVILMRISEEDGFPASVQRMLRTRMAKHHVAASLSAGIA